MGLELSDIFITLKPRSEWKRARTQEELVSAMARETKALPGMRAVYTQPIEMRINEMVAGIRADLGIKLYGETLETLKAKAEEIEKVVKAIPGAADTTTEQVTGLPVLRIRVDNEALSRYGVPAQQVLDTDQGRRRHRRRRDHRARATLPARGPAADGVPRGPAGPGTDPHHDRGRAAPAADPACADRREHRAIDHPTRLGRAPDHRPDECQGPRPRLVREGGPGANRPRRCHCRSVTRSNGAGSSSIWSGPSGGSTSSCRWPWR